MQTHSENYKIQVSQGSSKLVKERNTSMSQVLYKYYAFDEWTQNIFEKNEIYFQSPDCFNDPFDSKLYTTYEGSEDKRISRLIGIWREDPLIDEKEEDLCLKAGVVVKKGKDIPLLLRTIRQSVEQIRKQMGIFCMTTKRDDILMWSHYAYAHTGFCMEFKTENFSSERPRSVDYPPDRPCLNLIVPPDKEDIELALLTKAANWKYENEWRIVDHRNGPGVQPYPPEALTGVILGCRISPKNRQRITQWCKARDPRPALYWAEEKDREFGLDIITIC